MSGPGESLGEQPAGRTLGAVGWIGFVLVVGAALVRASVSFDPLPYWGSDPLVTLIPKTGFGPTVVAATDLAAIVGAALCVLGGRVGRAGAIECAALGLGTLGVVLHALVLTRDAGATGEWIRRGSLDHLLPGVTWSAALAATVGLRHACADPRARRLALGVLLGFVGMLAAKGAMQVFIEHPLTVRDYELRRDEALGARGWRPDSAMAQAYERRLYQADASAWFGLSNVLATFAAAVFVALCAIGAGVWGRSRPVAGLAALGSAMALGALLLTHSKGGLGAAAIGVAWFCVVCLTKTGRRWGAWLALAAPLAVIALVAGRGFLGDQLGELSLRFRAQYQVGAVGAWLESPLLGVGPGGFRDAFLRHRPPLSVEEVQSPHSVVFEWISTLGVFGVVWVGLLAWVTFGLGRAAKAEDPSPETSEDEPRRDLGVIGLFAFGATAVSAVVEREMATGEGAVMRVVGLVAWLAIAGAVAAALRGGLGRLGRAGIAAGGLVLVVHAMIEVTPVWSSSAPLWGALLGAAAGARAAPSDRRGPGVLGAAALAPAAVLALVGVWRAGAWERGLDAAAGSVRPAAEIRQRLVQIGLGAPHPGDSFERVRREVAAMLGESPAADPATFELQLDRMLAASASGAVEPLAEALSARDDHAGTRRALGRLHLSLTDLAESLGGVEASAEHAREAIRLADEGVALRPGGADAWAWRGAAYEALGERAGAGWLDEARASWRHVHELDPLGLDAAARLMSLAERAGDTEAAARWARESLRLDGLKRLDPLKRLTDEERASAERIAGGP